MNIYEKLVKIQNELKVPKQHFNNFGKYNYRNAEDILEALKPLHEKYKVCQIITEKIESIGERYYISANIQLIDIEKPESCINSTSQARESLSKKGMDDCQLSGSTSSYAIKYALRDMYMIDDTKEIDSIDNAKKITRAHKELDNVLHEESPIEQEAKTDPRIGYIEYMNQFGKHYPDDMQAAIDKILFKGELTTELFNRLIMSYDNCITNETYDSYTKFKTKNNGETS